MNFVGLVWVYTGRNVVGAFAWVAVLAVGLTLSRQRDAADGCSCREYQVDTEGRAPLGVLLYRHVGWLCFTELLSNAISFARMTVQSSLLIWVVLLSAYDAQRAGKVAGRPQDTVAASDASRSERLPWDQRRNGCCQSINARETVRDRDGS